MASHLEDLITCYSLLLQTILSCRYLSLTNECSTSLNQLCILPSSCFSPFLLEWLEEEKAVRSPDSFIRMVDTTFHAFFPTSSLSFILSQSHCISSLSPTGLLWFLRLLERIAINQQTIHCTTQDKESLMQMAFAIIEQFLGLESNSSDYLICAIPLFSHILLAFPTLSFTHYHLSTIMRISSRLPLSLQSVIYVIYHFILNNWKGEEEDSNLRPLLLSILFDYLPSNIIGDLDNDISVINQLLQNADYQQSEDYYKEYM